MSEARESDETWGVLPSWWERVTRFFGRLRPEAESVSGRNGNGNGGPPALADQARPVTDDRPAGGVVLSRTEALLIIDESGRVRRANGLAQRLFGGGADELVGRTLGSLISLGGEKGDPFSFFVAGGVAAGVDAQATRTSGERLAVLCSAFALHRAGHVTEVVCAIRPRAEVSAPKMLPSETPAEDSVARENLERLRAERDRLEAELKKARAAAAELQNRKAGANPGKSAAPEERPKDQLWAWAEDELRRLQGTVRRTRDKLQRVEDELERALKDRDWVEERRRRAEEETLNLREELQRAQRQLRAAEAARNEVEQVFRRAEQGRRLARQQRVFAPAVDDSGSSVRVEPMAAHATPLPRSGRGSEQLARAPLPGMDLGDGSIIDWAEALARVDGDADFLRAIASAFGRDHPALLDEIRAAIEAGEAVRVERCVRQLKGAVASFAAREAIHAAQKLEALARTGKLETAPQALEQLEAQLVRLRPGIEALRNAGLTLSK